MRPDAILKFEGGYVRPLITNDINDGYVNGLNDSEVNKYLEVANQPEQTHQSVINFVVANDQSPSSVLWGIWAEESESFFGTVRLHGIEFHHRTAHIGVCLFDKNFWGRRFGSKAISAVTKWALSDLKLRWIEAGAFEENVASQKTFLSAGYSWKYDINGKYILEGKPAVVRVFVAENSKLI